MLEIIHRPAFYLKHDVPEARFCIQVEHAQLGPSHRNSISPYCSYLLGPIE
jgi:hypothetical protein